MLSRRGFCGSLAGASLSSLLLSRSKRATAAAGSGVPNGVAMQAAWVNDAEFIGYFVAMQNGYYKAQDVDMHYLSGGPDVIPESSLLAGKAPVALTVPDTTIKAITTQGARFKIIGAQFQKTPIGVVSLESNPVRDVKALEGKVLAVPPVNMAQVAGMLRLNGVAKSAVRIVPYQFDPTPLIKGEIDASVDFVTDVPYTIGLAGKKATSFLLYDYGVTLYADTVVVTEEFLAANRAVLVRWLRASRQGWVENFKDPAKYPKMFENSFFKGTGRSTDNDVYGSAAEKPLIETPNGVFAMSEQGIAANIKYLNGIGIAADRSLFDTSLLEQV
jgi:ABC-type nitrate/sulfonate/bicarbonate transport system substrate-binding protein